MTKEEQDNIVKQVIVEVLNLMPETIGNLMKQHAVNSKIRKEFYDGHPDFEAHSDVVGAIVDKLEGQELGQDYEKVLADAVPEIARQIKLKDSLDTDTVKDKKDINIIAPGNFGEL